MPSKHGALYPRAVDFPLRKPCNLNGYRVSSFLPRRGKPTRKLVLGEHRRTPPSERALGRMVMPRRLFVGAKEKIQRQNGKKLRGLRPLQQRMPRQSLQPLRIGVPDDRNRCSNVPLHVFPGGCVMLCYFRVQPFCHQPQTIRPLCGQIHGISDVKEAGTVCRKPQPV